MVCMPAPGVRRAVPVGLAVLSALWLSVGCAGQQEEKGEGQELVSGSFVGEALQYPNALVAVTADKPGQGEEQREVRAYLSDGRTISEWFKRSVAGDNLALSSDGGAWLVEGQLAVDAATGTIVLADGRPFRFRASPATGIGCLYNVSISSDGQISGSSEDGGQLEGQLGQEAADGTYPITGTFTAADGEPEDFEVSVSNMVDAADYRWIVLPDGRFKGARRDLTTSPHPQVIDPSGDLARELINPIGF